MKRFLILTGIFTVLTCTANAQYYREYNDYQRPRQEQLYAAPAETLHYRRLPASESRQYRERRTYNYYKEENPQKNENSHPSFSIGIDGLAVVAKLNGDIDDYVDDSYNAFNLNAGIRFSRNFGIEGFWIKSTEEDGKKSLLDVKSKYATYGADLIGYIPLCKEADLLLALGLARYEFEADMENRYVVASADDDATGIRMGIGLQFYLTDNIALRPMIRYVQMTNDDYIKSLTELSFGLRYYFF